MGGKDFTSGTNSFVLGNQRSLDVSVARVNNQIGGSGWKQTNPKFACQYKKRSGIDKTKSGKSKRRSEGTNEQETRKGNQGGDGGSMRLKKKENHRERFPEIDNNT